ncbi:MAG: hypothetical protein ISP32_01045 [Thermoleophilia bacterium]|nr:hypothetical protein [Thermoleophilia bacterium]
MKLPTKVRRPSASMVIATTALVLAAGGAGAFAQSQINGKNLVNKSVTNAKMANKAVNNRVLAPNSVLASTLAPGAISTVLRYEVLNVPTGTTANVFARCNSGEDVVGGGFGGINPTSWIGQGNPQAHVSFSRPATADGQAPTNGRVPVGWNVGVVNESNQVVQASSYVVCLRA